MCSLKEQDMRPHIFQHEALAQDMILLGGSATAESGRMGRTALCAQLMFSEVRRVGLRTRSRSGHPSLRTTANRAEVDVVSTECQARRKHGVSLKGHVGVIRCRGERRCAEPSGRCYQKGPRPTHDPQRKGYRLLLWVRLRGLLRLHVEKTPTTQGCELARLAQCRRLRRAKGRFSPKAEGAAARLPRPLNPTGPASEG